ncbi:MAG: hypothetical protein Q8P51_10775 [Ignavibacteria bacterium]|nr:hypothetical protein [Ignavibacteria bacterium]
MRKLFLFSILVPFLVSAQTQGKTSSWNRLAFLEGKWEGKGAGEPGNSTVVRQYQFILQGAFLQVTNKSTFLPQEKNPKGEVHEDWGVFSRDRMRKLFVLRQFNIEGFVNQYTLDTLQSDSTTLVFNTEAIENIAPGWRAREIYKTLGANEFVETFLLAAPSKDFELYAKTQFRRAR